MSLLDCWKMCSVARVTNGQRNPVCTFWFQSSFAFGIWRQRTKTTSAFAYQPVSYAVITKRDLSGPKFAFITSSEHANHYHNSKDNCWLVIISEIIITHFICNISWCYLGGGADWPCSCSHDSQLGLHRFNSEGDDVLVLVLPLTS